MKQAKRLKPKGIVVKKPIYGRFNIYLNSKHKASVIGPNLRRWCKKKIKVFKEKGGQICEINIKMRYFEELSTFVVSFSFVLLKSQKEVLNFPILY